MALRIPGSLADEMIEHCRAGIPDEACGVLASKGGVIVKVLPMTNVDRSPVRYSFDPKEQFLAYRLLDDQGWELGGVFHSHTRTEALPSPTDVRFASEDVPYVIVSFESDPPIIRAFRIIKEEWDAPDGEVEEITVEIEG